MPLANRFTDNTVFRPDQTGLNRSEIFAYAVAFVLVPIFVNGIFVWRWLDALLPSAVLTVGVMVVVLPVVAWVLWRSARGDRPTLRLPWLLVAVVLIIGAFLLTDPAYPAKRIHIPEYILLSLVLRWAGSYRLSGVELTVSAGVLTGLLGVHDELLQGLHPSRYFGINDIVVNAISGVAGAAIGHAADWPRPRVWSDRKSGRPTDSGVAAGHTLAGTGLMLLALLLFIWVLARLDGMPVPVWAGLPLIGVAFFWMISDAFAGAPARLRPTVNLIIWLSVATLLAPMSVHVSPLVFA